jgi:ubiquinone/menaquinone biosynthesis C-methylase UbiE
METRVYQHRARWTARRLLPFLQPTDRVLDVGAGDCRLDEILTRQVGCEVVSVDVADYNKTSRQLTLFDGRVLPYEADSFDVALLIFVLHHAADPRAVLEEARRVCRRCVLVLEDVNWTAWDRWVFRGFHRWLEWSQKIPRPYHEWPPERWSQLALDLGFREAWRGLVGRQLGWFASRNIAFVWEKTGVGGAVVPTEAA